MGIDVTLTVRDTTGNTVSRTVTVATDTAPGGISEGLDILNNPLLVGCRIPSGLLVTVNDDYIAAPGEVVSGKHITGSAIMAPGCTFRDCVIEAGLRNYPMVAGALAEYCTVGRTTGTPVNTNLAFGGMTVRYCEVFGGSDNLTLNGDAAHPTVIDACWIHGLRQIDPGDHNDNGQMTSGASTTISRCYFNREDTFGQTSHLIIGADAGNISGVLIERNLFDRTMDSAGTQCLIWGHSGTNTATGMTFRANRIREYAFTIVLNSNDPMVWEGNLWYPSGDPCPDGHQGDRQRP